MVLELPRKSTLTGIKGVFSQGCMSSFPWLVINHLPPIPIIYARVCFKMTNTVIVVKI